MKNGKVRVEQLLGTLVRDSEGAKAGRILSIRAELEGEDCVVREYDLGTAALMARFGISLGRLAGWPVRAEPRRVPWDLLDLSDPRQPRLRCRVAELKART